MKHINLSSEIEEDRIKVLHQYDILDTPADESFDRLTVLVATLFQVPIALITLIDENRLWFKSTYGLDGIKELPKEPGLCASAVLSPEFYLVENAETDSRSKNNSLVAGDFGIKFYAAVPIRTKEGYNLGTFCIIDKKPRKFSKKQEELFFRITDILIDLIELKNAEKIHQRRQQQIFESAAHNLKNPLTIITLQSEMLKLEKDNPQEIDEICDQIKNCSGKMTKILDDMLISAMHQGGKMKFVFSKVNLAELLKQVIIENQVLADKKHQKLKLNIEHKPILQADKNKIKEIIDNLINNAIKYSPKGKNIFISLKVKQGNALLEIRDEGPGLTKEDKEKIFERFTRLSAKPTAGENSTGLGLSIVKALIDAHDGKVFAESEGKDCGSKFTIELPIEL